MPAANMFRVNCQLGAARGGLKTRDWKTWDQIVGVEKTALENTGPKRVGGNRRTGKHGTKFPGVEKTGLENAGTSCAWIAKCNIINVRGHVRVNVNAGRRDPRTLQEATQSGN